MDSKNPDNDGTTAQEPESEQSIVGKFKSHVSDIISNTPLSKWFRKQSSSPTVRRREEDSDDDEEFFDLQPPTKRTKLPTDCDELSLSEVISPITNSTNKTNYVTYKNFPEPVAGPSGYNPRRLLGSASVSMRDSYRNGEIVNIRSGGSEGEIPTSGYCSTEGVSKETANQGSSKCPSPVENSPAKSRSLFRNTSSCRSLFTERSLSPNVSSRMPSFDASVIGSSSFVDKTLSTRRIINSPFYSGRTIYGGASAYSKTSRTPQDLRTSLKNSIQIKPVNRHVVEKKDMLGKTARRILDALEQYSSPVNDAKKIPFTSKRARGGMLTKYTGANPYMLRTQKPASSKELQVPSVTDLLKMKQDQQKTRLQESTEAVRQIATQSKSILNEKSYTIPENQDKDTYRGKMKTKITSVRHKSSVIEETVPEIRLNPIALPIKEMPKFDIVVPPPASQKSEVIKAAQFEFSAPLILSEAKKQIKAYNNFKFSEPLCKKRRSIHPELDSKVEVESKRKNNGENVSVKNLESSASLWEKFKPAEGSWECSSCMLRNQPDKTVCVACKTPKSAASKAKDPVVFVLDNTFIPPPTTWECTTCMIRHQLDTEKCPSCGAMKPGWAPKAPVSDSVGPTPAAPAPPLGFGSKFAPPPSSWECPNCMIRNKDELNNCIACQSARPGPPKPSFGTKFNKKDDEWDCSSCCIRNNVILTKCQCCGALKPGATLTDVATPTLTADKTTTFSFGVSGNAASGFTFGVPPVQSEATGFSFGVPPTTEAKTAAPAPTPAPAPAQHTDTKKTEDTVKKSEASPTFSFGVPSNTNEVKDQVDSTSKKPVNKEEKPVTANPLLKPTEKLPERATAALTGFTFGLPTSTPPKLPAASEEPPKKKPQTSEAKTEPSKVPMFNFKPPEANKVSPFAKSKEEGKAAASSTFNFSFATPKPAPVSTSSGSSFTLPPTTTAVSQADGAKMPVFKFGTPSTEPPKTTSLNNGYNFGSSSSFTAPSFSATPTNTTSAAPKTFSFSSPKSATAKTSGFAFGGSDTPEKNSIFHLFAPATAAETKTNSTPTFAFGATTNLEATDGPKAPVFAFGAPSSSASFGQQPQQQAASFGQSAPFPQSNPSFGQSTNAPFGSQAPAPSFGNSTTPAFGQAAPGGAQSFGQASSSFNFGSSQVKAAEPAFGGGQQQATPNGLFSFGAGATPANQTGSAGFSFGGSGGTSGGQSGFNFSGATTTLSQSGGFNFTGAPPSFDANAKPSFNFTGGTGVASFSAPPVADGSHQPRRIKKAVRRSQVR